MQLNAQTTIERGPYVQNVSATSALIAWTTSTPGDSIVEYWSDSNQQDCRPQAPCQTGLREDAYATKWHGVTLSNLLPSTDYSYQVRTSGRPLADGAGSFRTAPAPSQGSEIAFVVFGDSGRASPAQYQLAGRLMSAGINGKPPDLMLHTGDIVYGGTDLDTHQRFYDLAFFSPYREIIRHVPIFPVPGNHEYDTANAKPFLDNFYLPGIKRYYSFDYGDVHFVGLDSELLLYPSWDTSGGNQLRWLEEDLQRSNAMWKVVYLHKPPFSSGNNAATEMVERCPAEGGSGRTSMTRCIRSMISPIIQKYNVDLVFSGHDHVYELFRPLMVRARPGSVEVTPNNGTSNGVVHVITGGGGAELYKTGQMNPCAPNYTLANCRIFPRTKADGLDPNALFHVTRTQLLRENHTGPMTLKLDRITLGSTTPEESNLAIRKDILTGRVTDGSNPVANAEVKILIHGQQRAVTRTAEDGRFWLHLAKEYEFQRSRHDAGTYQLAVTAPGFSEYCEDNISVPRTLDAIHLKAGSAQPCSFKGISRARWIYNY
jgi:predicted phosphodiesterase